MAPWEQAVQRTKKRSRPTVRPITVGLIMLRCKELNLSFEDLVYITPGEVLDMLIERGNDSEEWEYAATQADIDRMMR